MKTPEYFCPECRSWDAYIGNTVLPREFWGLPTLGVVALGFRKELYRTAFIGIDLGKRKPEIPLKWIKEKKRWGVELSFNSMIIESEPLMLDKMMNGIGYNHFF